MSDPIKYRGWNISPGVLDLGHHHAFEFAHDDYDGAEDAFDNRCGYAASVEAAKREIDDREDEAAAEEREFAARADCPDCGARDCNINH